ncbi:MAG: tRNA 2-thiouridine(34) synthase MnmA [Planctomycetota bacterium]
MSGPRKKVLVAMSGGVDSSVAAALLLEQGYDVVGVFMRLGSPGDALDEMIADTSDADGACDTRRIRIGKQGCCSINDAADARLVAAHLGVPFYVCNFKKDFGRIIDYFVDEYAQGRTPNPCVRCNDWLKFGKLHAYAEQIGASFVASGHYARVETTDDGCTLRRGIDHGKDQSYVLFGVPRAQMSQMLLPVGGFTKPRIREMAEQRGLPVFDKPDSQEICFVPDNDYAGLVERRRPDLAGPGDIVTGSGEVLGQHGGQHRFTVGQRRGIGVALGHPLYVIEKRPADNTVLVGDRDELLTTDADAREANWLIDAHDVKPGLRVLARYRYNAEAVPARLTGIGVESDAAAEASHSGRNGTFSVAFDEPQQAVAPGQALVIYDASDADRVLGGGWIARTTKPTNRACSETPAATTQETTP